MACIKSVNRSASVAFSPDSPYLATGTMAGAVDMSFSSSANLEIFKLDFQNDDQELPVVGKCPSSERFNRLSWGKTKLGSEEFALGLIAGGLVDGSIGIWNPLTLISSNSVESAPVGRLTKHSGSVRGLEFNANIPNLLASGADGGEICIWDLENPAEPTLYPPLKSVGAGAQGEVSFLSWNHKVRHIFASTSYNGSTVVWDINRQKPVISFTDPNRIRCSVLQWNPDVATQLIVASDDDNSPSLKLWDMRNTISPLQEFVGHTKGVIAMSWCPMDSSFLVTCSKDNRTICWDTVSGEIVSELPVGMNWNFDVQWYPKIPGLVSASSFDGKIGIYNVEGGSRLNAGEAAFGAVNLRAPKWMKCPVGVSFGFGGKVASFKPSTSAASAPTGSSEIYLHNLVTEDSLVSRSAEFEAAIRDGEKSSLRLLCDKKSEESKSEDDRETWGFLKVMCEDDGTARTKLLAHLGFTLRNDEVQDELSQEISDIGLDERITDEAGSTVNKSLLTIDNEEDFFNNLQSPKADTLPSCTANNVAAAEDGEESQQELDGNGEGDSTSSDDSIRRALVVGDYKEAVSLCVSENRMADALVIAHLGGASLWESTRDQYLKKSHQSYLKVVSAMVQNDLMSLVNTRPLNSWKETLALLCNFAETEWTVLCDSLASRLMAAGNTLAATLCYICAGNVEKAVEIWSRSLKHEPEGRSYVDLLQDLMEKTIILASATGQKRFSAPLSKLVENYAELLASQGLLTTALEYLKLLGSEESSQEISILRDRIALSAQETEAQRASPFENNSLPKESAYGADPSSFAGMNASQNYYQQQPHDIPASVPYPQEIPQPVATYYQQQPYGGGYSTPYQQAATQPNIFVPSPTPPVTQANFPPMVVAPTSVKSYVPSDARPLRDADKYHQQATLGSQIYAGGASTTYQTTGPPSGPSAAQVGTLPGHTFSQGPTSFQAQRSFMPGVNNNAAGYSPKPSAGGPMQPPSPTQSAQVVAAPTPATPPPTVQTVDTSKVPAHQKPVISTLTRLFMETSEALGGARANPAKKREIEDNSRKIGALFTKLNCGDISKNAADKLAQLCQALDKGDFGTALQIQVLLTTSEWDECNFWLATLKRMIKTRQNVR